MNDYWMKWFGWSWSRHTLWAECPLKYYYSYIGKWESDLTGHKVKMLSKLTDIPIEKGGIIHDIIRQQIHHHYLERKIKPDAAKHQFERKMNDLKYNKNKLVPHYNKIYIVEDKFIDDAITRGLKELDIFFYEIWPLYSESKYIQHEQFETFELGGRKIWVVVDFISMANDNYVITDWKTGEPEEIQNIEQMKAYALWAHQKFNVDYSKIITEVVFLQNAKVDKRPFLKSDIDEFVKLINIDLERWWNVTGIDDFPATPINKICRKCNYLTVCASGQEAIDKTHID